MNKLIITEKPSVGAAYAALTDEIEMKLDEADKAAAADSVRYTEDEVFSRVRNRIHERKAL